MSTSTSDNIYKILEKEILDLKIKPGEPISENDLCVRFDVSRTPIRSVLQRLQENGLVHISPYKTTTVTLLDYDIIGQIIYQRVAVESMVLRDFMRTCSPLLIEKLRYLIRSSRVLLEGEFETSEFYALDSALHEVWFQETRKTYLWECIQNSQPNYSRFRMLDIVTIKDFDAIVSEHEKLLDIIIRKDYDAIEPTFEKHFNGGITRLGDQVYTTLKNYFIQRD